MAIHKQWKNPSKEKYINRYEATAIIHHERLKEYFCPDYYQIRRFNWDEKNTMGYGSPPGTVGA
jgi:hypothetical protein